MPRPTTPTLAPYTSQLPDVNNPATWAERTPLFWNWVTGPGYTNLADLLTYSEAAIDFIDGALLGSETLVDAVAAIPLIGIPFPVWDHITGCPIPSNAGSAKFIKLTAGLTGVGQYNEGLLTSESVSGSAPEITATAVIVGGPMDGQTVPLINTEQAFLRPRTTSGTLQTQSSQDHKHRNSMGFDDGRFFGWLQGDNTPFFGSELISNVGRVSVVLSPEGGQAVRVAYTDVMRDLSGETRPRNRSVTYYMRTV
ncbi:hypothetical protein [Yoonia vestfoldensis]|uniref:Phage tail protein n=1 Tax=Yoonia vestfoldensis TaxID=245188 RepID=A0A1Y0EH89_9RHOB|nr:hypothetical protein [Yoonia vestfoldensis]ARU02965.1 hypothetical protein LOKVESSMR4R_03699 [Yoonia vestfoldensis]